MKFKKVAKETLTDPLHWLGWILTTAAVGGVLWLMDINLFTSSKWLTLALLLVAEVSVDVVKHWAKLQ